MQTLATMLIAVGVVILGISTGMYLCNQNGDEYFTHGVIFTIVGAVSGGVYEKKGKSK